MKYNVLFILVDSLRADKFYKSSNNANPTIHKLIQDGTYFSNTFSSSDYTVTGYGSIFTARYPINAGLTGMNYHKIFSTNKNYISLLQDSGYHTYTTMDNSFQNLGFSSFFENEDQGYDRTTTNLFEGLDQKILYKITSGNLKEPWFYFIHIDDLHIPVRVPKEHQTKNYNERYDVVVSKIDSWLNQILEKIDLEKTIVIITSDHGDYIPNNDKAEKFNFNTKLKSKLKKRLSKKSYDLLSSIKKDVKKQVNDTLLVSSIKNTIDSRTSKNRYLYDDVIHVPLLFFGKTIQKNGVINDLARSIDIFPTLWEILELPKIDFKIDGRSLSPLFENKSLEKSPVYLENTVFATGQEVVNSCIGLRTEKYKFFRSLLQNNPSKSVKEWWKNLSASNFESIKNNHNFSNISKKSSWSELTFEQHESIRSYYNLNISTESSQSSSEIKNDDIFLYDLESDPNELKNISESEPDLVQDFEKNLRQIRTRLLNNFNSPVLDDDESKNIEDELKKLGYV